MEDPRVKILAWKKLVHAISHVLFLTLWTVPALQGNLLTCANSVLFSFMNMSEEEIKKKYSLTMDSLVQKCLSEFLKLKVCVMSKQLKRQICVLVNMISVMHLSDTGRKRFESEVMTLRLKSVDFYCNI